MASQHINFSRAVEQVTNSSNFTSELMKWSLASFAYLVVGIVISLIFAFLGTAAMGNDIAYALVQLANFAFSMLLGLAIGSVIYGYQMENLKYLLSSNQPDVQIDQIPQKDLVSVMQTGFKRYLVDLIYTSPALLVTVLIMIGATMMSTSAGNINSDSVGIIGLLLCVAYIFVFIYYMGYYFMLRPVVSQLYTQGGFSNALNVGKVFGTYNSSYLKISLILFAVYVGFVIMMIPAYLLVFLCVGIFLLPVLFAAMLMVQIYIEPMLLAQIAYDETVSNVNEIPVEV